MIENAAQIILDIFKHLESYPLERETPPDWADPENQMHRDLWFYERYPGKDYVVGFCDSFISEYGLLAARTDKKVVKDFCSMVVRRAQRVRIRRINKLSQKRQQTKRKYRAYSSKKKLEAEVKNALF